MSAGISAGQSGGDSSPERCHSANSSGSTQPDCDYVEVITGGDGGDGGVGGGSGGGVKDHLMEQLTELQTAVSQMKNTFTEAMQQLSLNSGTSSTSGTSDISGTSGSSGTSDARPYSDLSVADKLNNLQTDIHSLRQLMQTMALDQERTEQKLQGMARDRQQLLQQLLQQGTAATPTLDRFPVEKELSHASRSSSGCHSNDSGVAMTTASSASSAGDSHELSRWRPDRGSRASSELARGQGGKQTCGSSQDVPCYESDYSLSEETRRCQSDAPVTCNDAHHRQVDDGNPIVPSADSECEDDGEEEERLRLPIVAELLETERSYCRTMWTVQDVFVYSLKVDGMLSHTQLRCVFGDELSLLHEKHCRLMNAVQERINCWRWRPKIADLMLTFFCREDSQVLRLYSAYIRRFPDMLMSLRKLRNSSVAFSNLLQARQDHPGCGGLDLPALLLAPVQRLPRYVLLLKQLLLHTAQLHCDHQQLAAVLKLLTDFLSQLDDTCCTQQQQLQEGHNSWRSHHKQPQRRGDKPRKKKRSRAISVDTHALGMRSASSTSTICSHYANVNGPGPAPAPPRAAVLAPPTTINCCCHCRPAQLPPLTPDGAGVECRSLAHVKRLRQRGLILAARSETCLHRLGALRAPSGEWTAHLQLDGSPEGGTSCRCDCECDHCFSPLQSTSNTAVSDPTDAEHSIRCSSLNRNAYVAALDVADCAASRDKSSCELRRFTSALKNAFTLRKRRSKLVIFNDVNSIANGSGSFNALYTPLSPGGDTSGLYSRRKSADCNIIDKLI